MNRLFFLTLFILSAQISFSQSIDATFSKKKMKKDLSVFIEIREKANSGLYKYRTKQEIDSIYNWAFKKIEKSETYIDFYNIICTLTDFEGSLHNDTSFPNKFYKSLKNEKTGYFPLPIKLIENKLIVNIQNDSIPLGAEIISINNKTIKEVISNLYKYYTTDGINISGKSIGLNYNFSNYYRFYYGLQNSFDVTYKSHKSNKTQHIILQSTSYANYYKNIKNRYSKPFDEPNYKDWKEDEIYSYKSLDNETGILTINDFGLGNEKSSKHIKYVQFLDSVFSKIKTDNIKNLIVDVRYNGVF